MSDTKPKWSTREKSRLAALRNADEALYRLWKQSEIGSAEMAVINSLQIKFIHPAIKEAELRKSKYLGILE